MVPENECDGIYRMEVLQRCMLQDRYHDYGGCNVYKKMKWISNGQHESN